MWPSRRALTECNSDSQERRVVERPFKREIEFSVDQKASDLAQLCVEKMCLRNLCLPPVDKLWLLFFVLAVVLSPVTCSTEIGGLLDECDCSIDSIKQFNSFRIYPQIQSIARKDYFRYFKVDLTRTCPFWHDDSKCALKDCSVEACHDEEVPFVKAEKLRLEQSGSGDTDNEEQALRSSESSHSSIPDESIPNGFGDRDENGISAEVPYYERAKTQSQENVQSSPATATAPARVEESLTSTLNIVPTKTGDEIRVTMATTLQPTTGNTAGDKEINVRSINSNSDNATESSANAIAESQDDEASCQEHNQTLGKIDGTISDESRQEFEEWRRHDDKLQDFCVFDDEHNSNASYFDLLINPERFTGYAGPSARRVWESIYQENCFNNPSSGALLDLNQMCYEERVFYRAISGLHSSINIHLCAEYYLPKMGKFLLPGDNMWGPNLEEFNERFSDDQTNGEGSNRIKNLYFVYLLELRAINKAAPFLEKAPFFTSRFEDTEDTRKEVQRFLKTVSEFKYHFDEKKMFTELNKETIALKEELRQHFRNISLIMDCVGCDKCRLWGKLQTQGLGTAFKILFSNDASLELSRTEIVTLFNAFSRLSNSLIQIENFRKLNEQSPKKLNGFGFGSQRKVEL